jgi:hypothetical protein
MPSTIPTGGHPQPQTIKHHAPASAAVVPTPPVAKKPGHEGLVALVDNFDPNAGPQYGTDRSFLIASRTPFETKGVRELPAPGFEPAPAGAAERGKKSAVAMLTTFAAHFESLAANPAGTRVAVAALSLTPVRAAFNILQDALPDAQDDAATKQRKLDYRKQIATDLGLANPEAATDAQLREGLVNSMVDVFKGSEVSAARARYSAACAALTQKGMVVIVPSGGDKGISDDWAKGTSFVLPPGASSNVLGDSNALMIAPAVGPRLIAGSTNLNPDTFAAYRAYEPVLSTNLLHSPSATDDEQVPNIARNSGAAAAHLGALVANMLERNRKLTPAQIRNILTQAAQDVGQPTARQGHGVIDGAAAIRLAGQAPGARNSNHGVYTGNNRAQAAIIDDFSPDAEGDVVGADVRQILQDDAPFDTDPRVLQAEITTHYGPGTPLSLRVKQNAFLPLSNATPQLEALANKPGDVRVVNLGATPSQIERIAAVWHEMETSPAYKTQVIDELKQSNPALAAKAQVTDLELTQALADYVSKVFETDPELLALKTRYDAAVHKLARKGVVVVVAGAQAYRPFQVENLLPKFPGLVLSPKVADTLLANQETVVVAPSTGQNVIEGLGVTSAQTTLAAPGIFIPGGRAIAEGKPGAGEVRAVTNAQAAAPHVTAAILNMLRVNSKLRRTQIIEILKEASTPATNRPDADGAGVLDVHKAISLARTRHV